MWWVILLALQPASHEAPAPDCWETAVTQAELNECAGREARAAEEELNRTLDTIRAVHSGRPGLLAALEKAQAAWTASRDADASLLWPLDESHGSILPTCLSRHRTAVTKDRIRFLRGLIEPSDEGDVCGGARHAVRLVLALMAVLASQACAPPVAVPSASAPGAPCVVTASGGDEELWLDVATTALHAAARRTTITAGRWGAREVT